LRGANRAIPLAQEAYKLRECIWPYAHYDLGLNAYLTLLCQRTQPCLAQHSIIWPGTHNRIQSSKDLIFYMALQSAHRFLLTALQSCKQNTHVARMAAQRLPVFATQSHEDWLKGFKLLLVKYLSSHRAKWCKGAGSSFRRLSSHRNVGPKNLRIDTSASAPEGKLV